MFLHIGNTVFGFVIEIKNKVGFSFKSIIFPVNENSNEQNPSMLPLNREQASASRFPRPIS